MGLKFKENTQDRVKLGSKEIERKINEHDKPYFIYSIVDYITGETEFNATEKLHTKIQDLGVGPGDSIYISKVKDEEINNGYPFFKVEIAEVPIKKVEEKPAPPEVHKSIEKFEAQFNTKEPDRKTQHDIMWKWYQGETAEKGHKEGDELF